MEDRRGPHPASNGQGTRERETIPHRLIGPLGDLGEREDPGWPRRGTVGA